MPECVSTSKRLTSGLKRVLGAFALGILLFVSLESTLAQEAPPAGGRTEQPEEEDFQETPYTRYGEFNRDDEEEEELRYMQYGRFFGVSLGVGYEGALGNRGSLYSGGFPAVELKVAYWFDFNLALTFGFMNATHSFAGQLYSRNDPDVRQYDLNIFRFGVDLRYYFDVQDASAPITFANPYLSAGVHSFTRTLTNIEATADKDTEGALGFSVGAGLEFTMKPRSTYFNLEGRLHQVNFSETRTAVGTGTGTDVPNQSGPLYVVMGSVLFTW